MYNTQRPRFIRVFFFLFMFSVIVVSIISAFYTNHNNDLVKKQTVQEETTKEEYTRPKIPEFNAIRVSQETRDYMYPQQDPLNEYNEDRIEFETPINPISNSENAQTKAPKFTEFNPFQTAKDNSVKDNTKTLKKELSNTTLLNIDGGEARDFDIMGAFTINKTDFYVIAYSPVNIQKYKDFLNRKYYIYKSKNNELVQCFDLFERQERVNKDKNSLISVSSEAERTKIVFNGANRVERIIDNNQLLSPYIEKSNKKLLIKNN